MILPGLALTAPAPSQDKDGTAYIVQAADVQQAQAAVENAGGYVTHDLGIIQAVGAPLSQVQVEIYGKHSRDKGLPGPMGDH